jgi:hypothetical protein
MLKDFQMQKPIVTTLAAAIVGTAALFAAPVQAQTYMMPDGPVVIDSPGYYSAPMEVDSMATGSIVVVPQQMGQMPGETWIGYCSRKYSTYNRTSNTYMGPDGQQYLCQ